MRTPDEKRLASATLADLDRLDFWREELNDIFYPQAPLEATVEQSKARFLPAFGIAWLMFCLALFAAGLFAGAASQRMATIERIEVIDVTESAVVLGIDGAAHEYAYVEGSAE